MPLRALSLSLVALLAFGCGLIPPPSAPDAPAPVELDQAAPLSTQVSTSQGGVRMHAEYEGNRLWFQIDNFEFDGLLVAPESFAVGGHMQEVIYSRDEAVLTRFAPQVLELGASMAGEMVVIPVESLENYHLLFHSTQTEPRNWSCEILPRAVPSEEPETEAP